MISGGIEVNQFTLISLMLEPKIGGNPLVNLYRPEIPETSVFPQKLLTRKLHEH